MTDLSDAVNGEIPTTRRKVVFVDPQDKNASYWWPALVVPKRDFDIFRKLMSEDFEEPNDDEYLVCYFEDGSFSLVQRSETVSFSPYADPYKSYLTGECAMDFRKDKAVILATIYWQSAKPPPTFTWLLGRKDGSKIGGDKNRLLDGKKGGRMRKERRGRKPVSLDSRKSTPKGQDGQKYPKLKSTTNTMKPSRPKTQSPDFGSTHTFSHKFPSPISEPQTSPIPSVHLSSPASSPNVTPERCKQEMFCLYCHASLVSMDSPRLCHACKESMLTYCYITCMKTDGEMLGNPLDGMPRNAISTDSKRKRPRILKRTRLWSLPPELVEGHAHISEQILDGGFLQELLPQSKKRCLLAALKST